MSTPFLYPEHFPLEDMINMVQMLRKAKMPTKALACKHGWVTAGYILRMTVGEPKDEDYQMASVAKTPVVNPGWGGRGGIATDEQAATILETIIKLEHEPAEYKESSVFGALGAINTAWLIKELAILLLPYLIRWIENYIESEWFDDDEKPVELEVDRDEPKPLDEEEFERLKAILRGRKDK